MTKDEEIAALKADLDTYMKIANDEANEAERLRAALIEAVAELIDWGSYVPPYFQRKHDYHGTVERLRKSAGMSQEEAFVETARRVIDKHRDVLTRLKDR